MGKKIGNKTFKTKRGRIRRFKSKAGRDRFARVSDRLEKKGRR